MRYMFRPRPGLVAEIAKERAKLPAGEPFIGLHVRHGDKCRGDRARRRRGAS